MAIRKSVEETMVVAGTRTAWMDRCRTALESSGFTHVSVDNVLDQVSGNYKKLTTWGDIRITLIPEGEHATRITVRATAAIDNVYALVRSPGRKIIDEFKSGLPRL